MLSFSFSFYVFSFCYLSISYLKLTRQVKKLEFIFIGSQNTELQAVCENTKAGTQDQCCKLDQSR